LIIVLAAVLLAALLGALFKDALIRKIVCRQIETKTGVSVAMERLHYNPFKTSILIKGFKLGNPSEFGGGDALYVKRVYVDTSISGILSERIQVDVCEIDIGSMRVVTAGRGASNIELLAGRLQSELERRQSGKGTARVDEEGGAPAGVAQGRKPVAGVDKKDEEIEIGYLKLRLGKIRVESETVGGRKMEPREYVVDQTFEYRDVDDLDPVAQQILMVVAVKTGPDILKDLTQLLEENTDDLDELGDKVKDAADRLGEELKDLF